MADYYPLITRAVAGLEKSTGEGRRALYERARNALVEQLRGVQPPLSETDITRERLALEEAIRKVEAEAVRMMRGDPPAGRAPARAAESQVPEAPVQPAPEPEHEPESLPAAVADEPELPMERPPERARETRTSERRWLRRPAEAEAASSGIKGFSDVVADAENLGGATAEAGRVARETYSSVPSPTPEFDRLEPRLDGGAPPRRPVAPPRARPSDRSVRADLGPVVDPSSFDPPPYPSSASLTPKSTRALETPMMSDSLRQVVERARRDQIEEDGEPSFMQKLMNTGGKIGIAAALILVVSGTIYWQRNNIAGLFKSAFTSKSPSAQAPARDAPQQRAKIPDRIGQSADSGSAARQQQQAEVPVAQRAVLYEDDPTEAAGRQYIGTVTWRAESSAPEPGQPPDRAVRAEISIPDRKMQISLVLRRNTDRSLPTSHNVHLTFSLPPDFSASGISEIRGMLMKQAEDTRGTSLAGIAVKVTPVYFLVGLSASDADVQRNMMLLKERSWFDIAIVYDNGRRAILAIEKGPPGERAFADAFGAWGQ